MMKKYVVELSDELSVIYEDIAKMNHKTVEESLAIITGTGYSYHAESPRT